MRTARQWANLVFLSVAASILIVMAIAGLQTYVDGAVYKPEQYIQVVYNLLLLGQLAGGAIIFCSLFD